jgi:hypothetical protein
MERFKISMEADRRKSLAQPVVDKLKSLDGRIGALYKNIDNRIKAKLPVPVQDRALLDRLTKEQGSAYRRLEQLSNAPPPAEPQQEQPAVDKDLLEAVRNTTAAQPVAPGQTQRFNSREEAAEAARSGRLPVGGKAFILGVESILTPQGFNRVQ